jgi:RNA polymerase sigma-70 factor (ECF subfamily)
MCPSSQSARAPDTQRPVFETTHWSIVMAAGDSQKPDVRAALATLCEKYWHPLYAYVRRRGYGVEEAQDLTQEFFTRFLEKNHLKNVHPDLGKFRSFLLASMNHFLADEWDRASAHKRGGGQVPISLDLTNAEGRLLNEPGHDLSPEKLFERRWAQALVENVLASLRETYAASGKEILFDALRGGLTGETDKLPYAKLADDLNMAETAVRVAIHRLRKRYRNALWQEAAHTVAEGEDVQAEIHYLFKSLCS